MPLPLGTLLRLADQKSHRPSGGVGLVPQHELQDAAVAEILDLVERIDPTKEGDRLGVPVSAMDPAGDLAARPEAF